MGKIERIVIAGVVVTVLFLIAWTVWGNHRDKIVVSSESAGIAQAAQFFRSFVVSASTTQIVTDKGTFLVVGTFQLIKGDVLYIEKHASGKRYICDHKNGTCNELAD